MAEISPETAEALERLVGSLGRATENVHGFADATVNASNSINGFTFDPLISAQKKVATKAEVVASSIQKLGQAAGEALQAFGNVQQGTGKYSSAVNSTADAFGKLALILPGYWKAVALVTDGMLKLAANSLKQNDALMKTYQTLSKFGAVDTQNFQTLLDEAHKAGYSIQNIGQFADQLAKTSESLALMGQGAAQGKRVLLDVFNKTLDGPTKEALMRFGYTTDEMLEKTGSYLSSLALSGGLEKRSKAELQRESVKYMETLSELTELTGKNRDDLDKLRKAQEDDVAWQIYIAKVRREKGDQAADQLMTGVQSFGAAFGPEQQRALQQRIRGFYGPEASKLVMAAGQPAIDSVVKTLTGTYEDSEAGRQKFVDNTIGSFEKTAKGFDRWTQQVGGSLTGTTNEQANALGIYTDTLKGTALFNERNSKKREEELAKFRKNMLGKESDDRIGSAATMEKNERQARNAQENLTFTVGKVAVPAVRMFSTMLNHVASFMAKMLKVFSLGFADYTKEFKDTGDTLEQTNATLKEYRDNQEEIVRLQERLESGGVTRGSVEEKNLKIRLQKLEDRQRSLATSAIKSGAAYEEQTGQRAMTEGQQREMEAASRGGMPRPAAATSQSSEDQLRKAGLIIKKGGGGIVQADRAVLDPKLIEIAKQIQSTIPGFKEFTSFNDSFHNEKASSSYHTLGKALDFTLTKKPSRDEGRRIKDMMRQLGIDVAIDEYNDPSSRSTAGHFHGQLQARTGGIFKGPTSGYKVELHGQEAVVPMPTVSKKPLSSMADFSSISKLVDILRRDIEIPMTKFNDTHGQFTDAISKFNKQLSDSPMGDSNKTSKAVTSIPNDATKMIGDLIHTLNSKLDDVIHEQRKSVSVNEKILAAARH